MPSESITLSGHIIDNRSLAIVLDQIIALGANFRPP